jgi:hypothetical protein
MRVVTRPRQSSRLELVWVVQLVVQLIRPRQPQLSMLPGDEDERRLWEQEWIRGSISDGRTGKNCRRCSKRQMFDSDTPSNLSNVGQSSS